MRSPSERSDAAARTTLRRLLGPLPRYLPALAVIAVLACMLVPLATPLVDLLLSLSLALAILLLVACLGVRRSADFLAFPSLLLLATLTRLALNVQTTRLILSEANAGQVIDAFARLVVRGEMIVGVVIFALITAVQYLVIARGAERVAEVAARFALDGLPGQQAAIDGDLRSGAISAGEAAKRRAALVERSRFYGAMDGAVRFVKGDAIAGLVITAINIVGGLAIGMLRRGMDLPEALDTYGRLTIGDGLVSQIPALLISLAAGVLVARVDREDERAEGRALAWVDPTMLLFPAALLAGLALIEGMPRAAFAVTSLGLVCLALWLSAGRRGEATPELRRIIVSVGDPELARASGLKRALSELRRRIAALGVTVPEIELEQGGADPSALEVRLGERLLGEGVLGERSEDAVLVEVFRALIASADALIDLHDLELELEALRARRPAVVREALRTISLPDLLEVIRGFLRERVPVPPLDALLGAIASDRRFAEASERSRWLELAREHTAAHWLRDLVAAHSRLGAPIWLRPLIDDEEALASRALDGVGGRVLTLGAGERREWLAALREAGQERPALILTTPAGRAAFASLVRGVSPFTPVVSTAEFAAAGRKEPEGDEIRWISAP